MKYDKHRDFVIDLVERGIPFQEAIMNLPQAAPEFLDVFIGLKRRNRYLYCISYILSLYLLSCNT